LELLSKLKSYTGKIDYGHIVVFSETKAFLIIKTDIEYIAVQLLNDGNEELGYSNYTDADVDNLVKRLKNDFGTPVQVSYIDDVGIDFN